MRYCAIDTKTDSAIQLPPPGAEIPPHVKFMFMPRIRCNDCPGKLYTPGPDLTAMNFEVHLKNRMHLAKVEARLNKAAGGGGKALSASPSNDNAPSSTSASGPSAGATA
jgi:SWI/SNF-related matrix-associated actin-dependent regulator of chromatin subfamily B protein 1